FSGTRFLTFPPPSYSLRWYEEYFGGANWMQSTQVSLALATLTVLIATPIGTAAAYAIVNSRSRVMRAARLVLLLPLLVPTIIIAIGIFFVYVKIGLVASMTGLVLAN